MTIRQTPANHLRAAGRKSYEMCFEKQLQSISSHVQFVSINRFLSSCTLQQRRMGEKIMKPEGSDCRLRTVRRYTIGLVAIGAVLSAPALAQATDTKSSHEAAHVAQQGKGVSASASGIEKSDIRRGRTRGTAPDTADLPPDSDGDGLPDSVSRKGGFKAGKALADTVKHNEQPAGGDSGPRPVEAIGNSASQVAGDPIPGIDISAN